jgi:energy-coupling factor transporter transmembrane protein EcfT
LFDEAIGQVLTCIVVVAVIVIVVMAVLGLLIIMIIGLVILSIAGSCVYKGLESYYAGKTDRAIAYFAVPVTIGVVLLITLLSGISTQNQQNTNFPTTKPSSRIATTTRLLTVTPIGSTQTPWGGEPFNWNNVYKEQTQTAVTIKKTPPPYQAPQDTPTRTRKPKPKRTKTPVPYP